VSAWVCVGAAGMAYAQGGAMAKPWPKVGRQIRYEPVEVDRWRRDGGQQRAG
jgi:hypothetical protein